MRACSLSYPLCTCYPRPSPYSLLTLTHTPRSLLGDDSKALDHLTSLFTYAESYGFADWLVFDASVVRGLSYYTGVVFEAFDRSGEVSVSSKQYLNGNRRRRDLGAGLVAIQNQHLNGNRRQP